MSNAPWTPGPWVATPSGRIMGTVYSQSWAIAERGQANLIAGCFSDVRDGLAKANARLIAEAPAMAEVLKSVNYELAALVNDPNAPDFSVAVPNSADAECVKKAFLAVRAILARINGGTP